MNEAFSLQGKRVLVTGAASGIGRAFAMLAAADGASVALFDIDKTGLDATVAEIENARTGTAKCIRVMVDLTQWDEVEPAVTSAVSDLGGLDIVCNVAGADYPGKFWEQPLELWSRLIAVNLWSTLYVLRATVPLLIDQRSGSIVNVASDAARVGSKGETVYSAAKAGILGLTKSLARELAPFDITVNALCPGPTNTPLMQREAENNPRLIEKLVRAIPLRRVGEPGDQAHAIAFLASEASSYMTGQVISVSGGLTMV